MLHFVDERGHRVRVTQKPKVTVTDQKLWHATHSSHLTFHIDAILGEEGLTLGGSKYSLHWWLLFERKDSWTAVTTSTHTSFHGKIFEVLRRL